jgi:hypothetical protein
VTACRLARPAAPRHKGAGSAAEEADMQPSEGLGTIGIVALALILVEVVLALAFGFTALIYPALLLTLLMFVVMLLLCRGTGMSSP